VQGGRKEKKESSVSSDARSSFSAVFPAEYQFGWTIACPERKRKKKAVQQDPFSLSPNAKLGHTIPVWVEDSEAERHPEGEEGKKDSVSHARVVMNNKSSKEEKGKEGAVLRITSSYYQREKHGKMSSSGKKKGRKGKHRSSRLLPIVTIMIKPLPAAAWASEGGGGGGRKKKKGAAAVLTPKSI